MIAPEIINYELTTIKQPAREKGAKACEVLQEIIKNPTLAEKPETIIFEPELIIRRSCGCLS